MYHLIGVLKMSLDCISIIVFKNPRVIGLRSYVSLYESL